MMNKIIREKEHYAKVDRQKDYRVAQNKFYGGIVSTEVEKCFGLMLGDVGGRNILSIGCGKGDELISIAQGGGTIIGIDIAEHRVSEAARRIASLNLSNAHVRTMDAECLEFQDSSFDIVFGRAILHHVYLEKCVKEASRVLKKGGHAVFIEPLAANPIINLYRRLTPEARSPYEHPLTARDIKIIEQYFKKVCWEVFHLTTFFSFLFRFNENIYNQIFIFFNKFDQLLKKRFEYLKRFYWITCIKCIK